MIRHTVLISLTVGLVVGSAAAQRGEPARQGAAAPGKGSAGGGAADEGAPGKAARGKDLGKEGSPRKAAPRKAAADERARPEAAPPEAVPPEAAREKASARAKPGQRAGGHAAGGKARAGQASQRRAASPGRARHREVTVVTAFVPRKGPAGTEVTIRGRQLDADGLEVFFAGEAVDATRSTARAITFEVPEDAGEGAIHLRHSERPNLVVGTFEVTDEPVEREPKSRRYEDHKKNAKARWAKRRKALPEEESARIEALREREEALRRSREERRRERAAALAAKLEGELRAHPGMQAELSLHAERQARLERMLRLAEAKADGALVVRIDVLQQREADRHQQRMNDLRAALRSR